MAIPTWYRTREVLASTWAIDDHGHDVMWLLRGTERALLVDTGFGVSDLAALATEIMGASLPLIVANTHGHHDHAGGNWQFPRVYIGAEDVAMVNRPMPEEARQAAMQRLLPSEDAAARELLAHGSFLEKWAATVPAEIVPIREVDDHVIGEPGPVTRRVQQRYRDIVEGRDATFAHFLDHVDT